MKMSTDKNRTKGFSYECAVSAGKYFFSIALIAFGVIQLWLKVMVVGRPLPWPAHIPGENKWAMVAGILLVLSGISIIVKKGKWTLISVGMLIFVLALLRHLIAMADHFSWGAELTNAGKSLALFGGILTILAAVPFKKSLVDSFTVETYKNKSLLMAGSICLGVFLIFSGVQHFMYAEYVKYLVPAWIPAVLFWTYFAGGALIAGGIGLMVRKTLPLAGLLVGVMIFLWVVLLHIPRALHFMEDSNEWTAVFEAVAFSGMALVLGGSAWQNRNVA